MRVVRGRRVERHHQHVPNDERRNADGDRRPGGDPGAEIGATEHVPAQQHEQANEQAGAPELNEDAEERDDGLLGLVGHPEREP